MGRPVMLGNGNLTVGLNEQGLVHDFYYPYVGLENLTTARSVHHKIGIWVDGSFSWVDDGTWNISVDFHDDALISDIRFVNDHLQIELHTSDFVDSRMNAFCRDFTVTNRSSEQREIRLFLHQVFQISRAGRADTALFVPETNYILDYKGNCSLLIYGQDDAGQPFKNYAVGSYGIEGKEGTFRDAEDGELSGSAVEHGGVDSVMRLDCQPSGGGTARFNYWIIAADSQYEAEKLHDALLKDSLQLRMQKTTRWWHEWFAPASNVLHRVDPSRLSITKKSLMVVKAHCDSHGGIIASCDSSIYNYGRDYYSYVWPRDGAYAMWPLIRTGLYDEPRRFFTFCSQIITNDGYLMHKYQPDKAIGSTWHPLLHNNRRELAIQEDETALVIFMLAEYLHYSGDTDFVRSMYSVLVRPAAKFMTEFIDEHTGLPHASYDLWERKFLTTTYTTCVTYGALNSAAFIADKLGESGDAVPWLATAQSLKSNAHVFFDEDANSLRNGFLLQDDGSLSFDNTLDLSSLYGAISFDLFERGDYISGTVKAVESRMLDKTSSGGIPRFEDDEYFRADPSVQGNPWIITGLWMSQYYLRIGDTARANQLLEWAVATGSSSGTLSEQIHPETGSQLSVSPLVWSHAELINTILDLSHKK